MTTNLVPARVCVKWKTDTCVTEVYLHRRRDAVPSDTTVFVLVVTDTNHQIGEGMLGMPKILETVSRDVEAYFAVVTSTHLLVVVIYAAAWIGF